jgi:hypothetical protein
VAPETADHETVTAFVLDEIVTDVSADAGKNA